MPRLKFDVIEMLEAGQGFGNVENYSVFRNTTTRKLREEYERLYALEDLMLVYFTSADTIPLGVERELKAMLGLHGQETGLLDFYGTLRDLTTEYFSQPTSPVELEHRIKALLGIKDEPLQGGET